LTELGLDTGYNRDTWQRDYFEHCHAGLEHELTSDKSPYIIKNPGLCETLERDLAHGTIMIDHALIPVRELNAAASSRIRIGGANGSVPGGLKGTSDPAQQIAVLGESFHKLVMTLTTRDIPHTFLLFPRFVEDADYAFLKLRCVLGNFDRMRFDAAFARIANPQLVHTFTDGQPINPANIAPFENQSRRKKHRRRLRRAFIWTAVAASLVLNISARLPVKKTTLEADAGFGAIAQPAALPPADQPLAVPYILAVGSAKNPRLADGSMTWVHMGYSPAPFPGIAQNWAVYYQAQKTTRPSPPVLLTEDAQ
jgi:hypothetical protein